MTNVTTLPANQPAWIDRLFLRMATMYGTLWQQRWHDVPMEAVKAEWEIALSKHSLPTIKIALDACAVECKFPPTLPEFNALCRESVRRPESMVQEVPRLTYDSTKAKAAIQQVADGLRKPTGDYKLWARAILAEAERGSYTNHHGIRCAKQALGMLPL